VESIQILADVFECVVDAVKAASLRFSVTVLPEHFETLSKSCDFSRWHKEEIEFLRWDISPQMEALWKELPKSKKSAVNRARREGVIIKEMETQEQVQQFYQLYTDSMIRGKLKPEPLAHCENLIKILKPKGMAEGFLALHPQTKQPIAGVMLLLGNHGMATYLQVGQDYGYRNLGTTDFLVWHCLEFLKSKGFTTFDLVGLPKGDSPRAEGIRHFKTAWAGANGHRYPSFVLARGNFGLPAGLMDKFFSFCKKCYRFFRGVN
jgi:lipid II:glycine glycyltransferase (peptidoglycan interpeptide bridge formation enzyme)